MLFFFNDTATTEIYTLSLHDALPICSQANLLVKRRFPGSHTGPLKTTGYRPLDCTKDLRDHGSKKRIQCRSEEHTSELQSLTNIVCRLLLEKKKYHR